MRKILKIILNILAKIMLVRYRPSIVAVTGSVGKTSTKDAIYTVLEKDFRVRKSEKSFNNEFGVPLTILGINAHGKNVFLWILSFIKVFFCFFWVRYPEILVLEFGVDNPKDMDYLLSVAMPDIAVVTAISEIPAHVEKFSGPAEIIREKTKLVKAVSKEGIVILNADYKIVLDMAKKVKAEVVTYGLLEEADVKIHEPELRESEISGKSVLFGMSFKVDYEGSVVPVRLNAYGMPSVYAASAACAVGLALGMNLVQASEALIKYRSPAGRLSLLDGVKNSVILDDSYNASPVSMEEALNILKQVKAKRKIAVLGSMHEIGKYSEESHREMGKLAASFCDIIVTVGDKARFIADEALRVGFVNGKNLFVFDTSEDLASDIESFIEPNDFILFKASRAVKLEVAIRKILWGIAKT